MSKRLIDKVGIYADFTGDPNNPEDLLAYFQRSGKVYDALGLHGEAPQYLKDYDTSDEFKRKACFHFIATAAAALLTHKGYGTVESMTAIEVASALRDVQKNEAPTRLKRIKTGRSNRSLNAGRDDIYQRAYDQFILDRGRPPGRKSLLYQAEKLCKASPKEKHVISSISEHSARLFLLSKTKTGEI